jgi:hypothetical protein
VPYLLSKGIAPYFMKDPVLLHTLHACSWTLYLALHILARTAAAIAHSIKSLHDRLRDEAFLVGVVLKNSTDHATDTGVCLYYSICCTQLLQQCSLLLNCSSSRVV